MSEHSFTCPKCGGHWFGSSTSTEDGAMQTVTCHGGPTAWSGGCGWSGPYRDYVHNHHMPGPCRACARGAR